MMPRRRGRTGTVLVEAALVYPVLFLTVFGILILGVGVFRYQQVAHIAREASRWASVHGETYAKEHSVPAATPEDVYASAIAPQAAGMGLENVSYAVTWDQDKSPTREVIVNNKVVSVSNTVSVTVTYTWNTGVFGTIPVSSTSVTTMSY